MLVDEILSGSFFEPAEPAELVTYHWKIFVTCCEGLGVTETELLADFTRQDIIDLAAEPKDKLHLHAKTIADAYQRQPQRIQA